MKNKKIILSMSFLLIVIFLSVLTTAAWSRSTPQLTSPSSSIGYLNQQRVNIFPAFNPEQCNAGQDFVIQVAPFGCTPAIVRSDLLEEQNVPVFCQLLATKINPLIEVEAIDFISFRGEYPEEIQGVGFHPARAAIRGTTRSLLNSPILQNIGYAVIVLKQQKNESSMPDSVSGNLTASVRYDIKNAFGIGKATQYLPEFTDDDWSQNFNQYGFWGGRAFLRADTVSIDSFSGESASISLYLDENNKLTSTNLRVGETSNNIYLPGFNCLAGLGLRLDGVVDPNTRARLNINGEIVQVSEGEGFLENRCNIADTSKEGLVEKAEIRCSTDNGGERFNLIISPRVKLSIGGSEKEAEVGDLIYNDGEKSYYLGYVGNKGKNVNKENLFVFLRESSETKAKLSEEEVSRIYREITSTEVDKSIVGIKAVNSILTGAIKFAGGLNIFYDKLRGKDLLRLATSGDDDPKSLEIETSDGKKITLLDFASPINQDFGNEEFKDSYEKAMKDFRTVKTNFQGEKWTEADQQTFGQLGLIEAINLSYKTLQYRDLVDLCGEFEQKYPKDKSYVEPFCKDNYKLASGGTLNHVVFVNGQNKDISLDGIYEPSLDEYSAKIVIRDEAGDTKTVTFSKNEVHSLDKEGKETVQLINLEIDSAEIQVNLEPKTVAEGVRRSITSSRKALKKDIQESFESKYQFTLIEVNLKKVAKVSVLPSIKDAGTEANFSFNIPIEKRAIQLSPEKTKKLIEKLNRSIQKWEDASLKLDKVVRGFNAACLAVGTTLTIKNLVGDLDGKAIARKEVMRSDGGWYDKCKEIVNEKRRAGDKDYSVDKCLLDNSANINSDVELVAGIIGNQGAINDKNKNTTLDNLKDRLGIQNPNVKAAFEKGEVTLTQARDLERLQEIIDRNPSSTLKEAAEKKKNLILEQIGADNKNLAERVNLANNLGINSENIAYVETRKDVKTVPYSNLKYSDINKKITISAIKENEDSPLGIIQTNEGNKYIVVLDDSTGSDTLPIKKAGDDWQIYDESGSLVKVPNDSILLGGVVFKKYDRTTYENIFKDPEVRFFETEPYKGLPAVVPFDTRRGWYVATKQTLPGFGALRSESTRAYQDSGEINSFYLCNVGRNGKEEFNTPSNTDDICRSFTPGLNGIRGEFPGLSQSETNTQVARAQNAINDAARQYRSGVSGTIRILNENIPVGPPEVGLPDIQCQDFMSPDDCNILFNVCDPVVCPSSRCDFGGSYQVADVVQSGIVGSTLLCLPNFGNPSEGGVAVPVCLTGIKAGIDSFVSIQENYLNCLQQNLETGETVGLCDEIHSIYLCDFFWSQAQPLANILVPKAIEYATGQTGRGGGEYLSAQTAWKNAGDSYDYLTNYYGASSFEAFKTGIIKEVGHEICKNFISVAYPEIDFAESVLRPESPPQYTGWFSEKTFTSATVPPTSQYKVFYHIFAGENTGPNAAGVYYSVSLKSPAGTSFYQTNPVVTIANGYIPQGEFASETRDFTAPSGYKELCINVNGQEECGFSQVSSSFAVDFVNDKYLEEQARTTDIKTESECLSGTPSLYSFATPNIQAGAEEFVNPQLYNTQIVRVCSTDNPGRGTDPRSGGEDSRWVEVGSCDEGKGNLKCFIDTKSVKDAVTFAGVENDTLKDLRDKTLAKLRNEPGILTLEDAEKERIKKLPPRDRINLIDQDLLDKYIQNKEKAWLILQRGLAYAELGFGLVKDAINNLTGKGGDAAGSGRGSTSPSQGTAPQTSLIFEFEDGSILNYNEKYFYDVQNKVWKWTNEKVKADYPNGISVNEKIENVRNKVLERKSQEASAEDLVVEANIELSEEDIRTIELLKERNNYLEGILLLIERTKDSKNLFHNRIFTIEQENGIKFYVRFEESMWRWSPPEPTIDFKEAKSINEDSRNAIISSGNREFLESLGKIDNFEDGLFLIRELPKVEQGFLGNLIQGIKDLVESTGEVLTGQLQNPDLRTNKEGIEINLDHNELFTIQQPQDNRLGEFYIRHNRNNWEWGLKSEPLTDVKADIKATIERYKQQAEDEVSTTDLTGEYVAARDLTNNNEDLIKNLRTASFKQGVALIYGIGDSKTLTPPPAAEPKTPPTDSQSDGTTTENPQQPSSQNLKIDSVKLETIPVSSEFNVKLEIMGNCNDITYIIKSEDGTNLYESRQQGNSNTHNIQFPIGIEIEGKKLFEEEKTYSITARCSQNTNSGKNSNQFTVPKISNQGAIS